MAKVYVSAVIPAPAGAVWAVVRDFNALPNWTPFVAESRIEQNKASDQIGCIRNFRLKDGGGSASGCSRFRITKCRSNIRSWRARWGSRTTSRHSG